MLVSEKRRKPVASQIIPLTTNLVVIGMTDWMEFSKETSHRSFEGGKT